jgi:hypothetical protein
MTTEIMDATELFQHTCYVKHKWGLWISYYIGDIENGELFKACPFLNMELVSKGSPEDLLTFFFDTEEEMLSYYYQVVGDDGPTEFNTYNGTARVYALTCDNNGTLLNENT